MLVQGSSINSGQVGGLALVPIRSFKQPAKVLPIEMGNGLPVRQVQRRFNFRMRSGIAVQDEGIGANPVALRLNKFE